MNKKRWISAMLIVTLTCGLSLVYRYMLINKAGDSGDAIYEISIES